MIFEVFRLLDKLAPLDPVDEVDDRKFEATFLGLPGLVQCFLQVVDLFRGFEGARLGLGALVLDLLELGVGLFKSAVKTLLVQAEAGDQVGALIERFGLGKGSGNEGIGGQRFLFLDGECEQIVLHRTNSIETPVGVSDGLDEFGFDEAFGLQFGVELGTAALVGGEVVGGQDDGLARETVAQGIERCATFPFRGDWARWRGRRCGG